MYSTFYSAKLKPRDFYHPNYFSTTMRESRVLILDQLCQRRAGLISQLCMLQYNSLFYLVLTNYHDGYSLSDFRISTLRNRYVGEFYVAISYFALYRSDTAA